VNIADRMRVAPRVLFGPRRPVEAGTSAPPRFTTLLLIAAGLALVQTVLAHAWTLRGAQPSPLTVLIVWTGLRCGSTTGGWLGFCAGALEDALGGGGTYVVASAAVGFLAGLFSSRFFADSLVAITSAVAAGTIVRNAITYVVLETALGERGVYHRLAHATAWEVLLNCGIAVIALLVARWWSSRR